MGLKGDIQKPCLPVPNTNKTNTRASDFFPSTEVPSQRWDIKELGFRRPVIPSLSSYVKKDKDDFYYKQVRIKVLLFSELPVYKVSLVSEAKTKLGMVVDACNLSIQEAGSGA
jgi:hypothetical protein